MGRTPPLNWSYSELMPLVPVIATGLSPLAQWIVIPLAGFWWARRPMRTRKVPAAASRIADAREKLKG